MLSEKKDSQTKGAGEQEQRAADGLKEQQATGGEQEGAGMKTSNWKA